MRSFATLEGLRRALPAFRKTCNATRLIEQHGFRSPAAIRDGQLSPAALAV